MGEVAKGNSCDPRKQIWRKAWETGKEEPGWMSLWATEAQLHWRLVCLQHASEMCCPTEGCLVGSLITSISSWLMVVSGYAVNRWSTWAYSYSYTREIIKQKPPGIKDKTLPNWKLPIIPVGALKWFMAWLAGIFKYQLPGWWLMGR